MLALATLFYAYRPGAIATAIIGSVFSMTAVACGLIGLKHRQPGAGTFLTGWSLLLIGVVLLALRTFNWLPTNLLTTYGMLIGSALEMLLSLLLWQTAFMICVGKKKMRRQKR